MHLTHWMQQIKMRSNISAMDILSSSGLVNYFGKWQSLQEITLDPILLQKNRTKIALYGLSHIPDCCQHEIFNFSKYASA